MLGSEGKRQKVECVHRWRRTSERRINKGGERFGVPSGLANCYRRRTHRLVSQQGHERKKPQQGRCGAQDRQVRPLALRLNPQVCAHRMESDLQRPSQDKPGQDLERSCGQIGAKEGLSRELAPWIAD
jgi:hypothetical protein